MPETPVPGGGDRLTKTNTEAASASGPVTLFDIPGGSSPSGASVWALRPLHRLRRSPSPALRVRITERSCHSGSSPVYGGLRAGRRQNRSSGAILGEKAMRATPEWLGPPAGWWRGRKGLIKSQVQGHVARSRGPLPPCLLRERVLFDEARHVGSGLMPCPGPGGVCSPRT